MRRCVPCAVVQHVFAHQRFPSSPSSAASSQAAPVRSDTPLVGGADARRLDADRSARHLPTVTFACLSRIAGNGFFPGIRFVALGLLRQDVLALEILVGPPADTVTIFRHGLGKELVAVACQRVDVYVAGLDRPKATATGFVPQVRVFVGGADEYTLTRLDHFLAAMAWPITLDLPRNECLELCRLGAVMACISLNFDQPFPPQMLLRVLAGRSRPADRPKTTGRRGYRTR